MSNLKFWRAYSFIRNRYRAVAHVTTWFCRNGAPSRFNSHVTLASLIAPERTSPLTPKQALAPLITRRSSPPMVSSLTSSPHLFLQLVLHHHQHRQTRSQMSLPQSTIFKGLYSRRQPWWAPRYCPDSLLLSTCAATSYNSGVTKTLASKVAFLRLRRARHHLGDLPPHSPPTKHTHTVKVLKPPGVLGVERFNFVGWNATNIFKSEGLDPTKKFTIEIESSKLKAFFWPSVRSNQRPFYRARVVTHGLATPWFHNLYQSPLLFLIK